MSESKLAEIRVYKPSDEASLIALWEDGGLVVPWNVPADDIRRKLDFQPELFIVAAAAGKIVGSVMAGYDGHRGWINYLAVDKTLQRGGLGRRLMEFAEEKLRAIGCPKINLQVRSSNLDVIAFYESIGFRMDEVVSLGKRLDGLKSE